MNENLVKLCMFDDYWIDFRQNAVRRWHSPRLTGIYEDPYFSNNGAGFIRYIPEIGKYRMWYDVLPDFLNDHQRYTALAESEDGISFSPSKLYPEQEEGRKHLLFPGSGTLLYDANEQDPMKRYKVAGVSDSFAFKTNAKVPVFIEYSKDGIRFTSDRCRIANPYTSDTINSLYHNPYDGLYYMIIRAAFCDRRIAVRTSRDLSVWSEPKLLLHPDPLQNDSMLQTQYYAMATSFHEGIFYGMLWRYQTDMSTLDFSKMFGTMDVEVAYSYDGKTFMRSGHRLIERPEAPDYGCWMIGTHAIAETADKMEYILSCTGTRRVHGTEAYNRDVSERLAMRNSAGLLYRLRKDGFCSVEGYSKQSQIITKTIELLNDAVRLNVNASTGSVRTAFLQPDGTAIEGFGYEDCIPFCGNDTEAQPRFRDKDLRQLTGRRVRLAIELDCASVYSVTMHARPSIINPQTSFANPLQLR